ncbi:histidine phosphatase family protein [Pseudomonadales bacterium]|nr:histidine phosphatase family protein [Pseudomonadales bacterium]
MKNLSTSVRFILLCLLVPLAVITLSSLVNLYDNKTRILQKAGVLLFQSSKYDIDEKDRFWSKEILNGGYILHFRHAEREKWIDVEAYDALESDLHNNGINESRYAENEYFHKAVCLNDRGKVQARAMGEHVRKIGLPIGPTVSSVSCRARQTADLAFGGYDSLHRILVHRGPYDEDGVQRLEKVKEFYANLPMEQGKNTVVSSHNGVITCEMFLNQCSDNGLEEGGFYIISKKNGGLVLEHNIYSFLRFSRTFYER